MAGKRWTEEENQALRRAIWEGATYDVMERLFPGRSRSSLQTRVHEIRACGMHGGVIVGFS